MRNRREGRELRYIISQRVGTGGKENLVGINKYKGREGDEDGRGEE
jgi:hypothetical protein